MAIANPHIRFHYEDYQTLPEFISARYELLDGDLLRVPAHPFTHNFIHPRRKPIGETQRRWQTL